MTDEITPALTPDEWELFERVLPIDFDKPWSDDMVTVCKFNAHAKAAVHLYGQPFGFTHDELLALTDLLNLVDTESIEDVVALCLSAKAKIAALLPPK